MNFRKTPVPLNPRGRTILSVGLVVLGLLVLALTLANWPKPASPEEVAEAAEIPPGGLTLPRWVTVAAALAAAVAVTHYLGIKGLVADFIARSWLGWVVLGLSLVWNITDGGHLATWKYFVQVTTMLIVGTGLGALYSLWMLARAADDYEYEEIGTGSFTLFAILLALWTFFVGRGTWTT